MASETPTIEPSDISPVSDRRRDEDLLSRLRDERDRRPRAARRARRAEAGPPPHPLRLPGRRLRPRPALSQVGQDRRRRDGQLPSARRQRDLRRARPDDPGLVDAGAADRRPGQFRLDGPRSAGLDALHRGAARQGGDDPARGSRQGHGRFHPQLRRLARGAAGAPRALPEPAGQRRRRHRGRHGDQHPAAQSRRGDRRLQGLYRQSGDHHRAADRDRPRPRFPDRAASSSASTAPAAPIIPAAARS